MGDNANARAAARSNAGMSRELQQWRDDHAAHPSRGGSAGYPLWLRSEVLALVNQHGMQVINGLNISQSSVYRWMIRPEPYRMTGGRERTQLVGRDQLLLAIGLFIHPDSSADQLAAFIVNQGGDLYDRQAISRRMKELDVSKKKCSQEAYQAFTEKNMRKARWFWSLPPPLGVVGLERRRLLDFDEMAVFMEQINPKYGHAHKSIRIRKPGHYSKSEKLTVIMAIEPGDPSLPPNQDGSVQNPRRWFDIREATGTNAVDFARFSDKVLTELETRPAPNDLDDDRCLMYDNLSSHLTPIVAQTIEGRPTQNRFYSVPRPPYQPKYGPIEYIFGQIGAALEKRVQPHWKLPDLKTALQDICNSIGRNGGFNNTFDHCGY